MFQRPTRLRKAGIVLIVLTTLLVVGDAFYLFGSFPAGKTSPIPSTSTPSAPATLISSPDDLYRTAISKTPFINDPLDGTHPASWGTFTNSQDSYAFRNAALHGFMAAVNQQDNFQTPIVALIQCPLHNAIFTNFAFQVRIAILQDTQIFVGLFFRANQNVTQAYRFYVDFYGDYNFTTEENNEPVGTNLSVFQPGLQAQNSLTLTVIAQNTSFYLYLNKKYLRKVSDATYSSGGIGFFVSRGDGQQADVAFSQAEVWR